VFLKSLIHDKNQIFVYRNWIRRRVYMRNCLKYLINTVDYRIYFKILFPVYLFSFASW